jgi:hypothetical protein
MICLGLVRRIGEKELMGRRIVPLSKDEDRGGQPTQLGTA